MLTVEEITKLAHTRYDALTNKPEWHAWYKGFIEGAFIVYGHILEQLSEKDLPRESS
jgi:hypothetical protein